MCIVQVDLCEFAIVNDQSDRDIALRPSHVFSPCGSEDRDREMEAQEVESFAGISSAFT